MVRTATVLAAVHEEMELCLHPSALEHCGHVAGRGKGCLRRLRWNQKAGPGGRFCCSAWVGPGLETGSYPRSSLASSGGDRTARHFLLHFLFKSSSRRASAAGDRSRIRHRVGVSRKRGLAEKTGLCQVTNLRGQKSRMLTVYPREVN